MGTLFARTAGVHVAPIWPAVEFDAVGIGRCRQAEYLCLRLTWAPVFFVTIILVFGNKKLLFSKSCQQFSLKICI